MTPEEVWLLLEDVSEDFPGTSGEPTEFDEWAWDGEDAAPEPA